LTDCENHDYIAKATKVKIFSSSGKAVPTRIKVLTQRTLDNKCDNKNLHASTNPDPCRVKTPSPITPCL